MNDALLDGARALSVGQPEDSIFALASGAGRGAISVLRLSGRDTGRVLATLCGAVPPARRAVVRRLRDAAGDVLDQALVLWMPGPDSFTGEDVAELHVHGGRAVLAAVSGALVGLGLRPADPGEFSKRAFFAGRMDLLEAEAIADLVTAETEGQRRQALRQYFGVQSEMLAGWAALLKRCVAFQEALIDFPDEDLPPDVEARFLADLGGLLREMEAQVGLAPRGERLRRGLVFAIVGAPNVGKSSLLNALARREIAIVSPIPGTTRDALEVSIELAGVPVTLIDTAGLRETRDALESEGIRRARARAASADLILCVVDAARPMPAFEGGLVIANKIDLSPAPAGVVGVSVLSGEGFEALEARLAEEAARLTFSGSDPVLTRERHAAAVRDATVALRRALGCEMPELRAEELRVALQGLGRITGAVDAEAILDDVFSAFCIGK
jgi:tRNA modification GTPase